VYVILLLVDTHRSSEHSYLASLLAVATLDEQRASDPRKQTSRAAKVRVVDGRLLNANNKNKKTE
jgi:hypothetical protein